MATAPAMRGINNNISLNVIINSIVNVIHLQSMPISMINLSVIIRIKFHYFVYVACCLVSKTSNIEWIRLDFY